MARGSLRSVGVYRKATDVRLYSQNQLIRRFRGGGGGGGPTTMPITDSATQALSASVARLISKTVQPTQPQTTSVVRLLSRTVAATQIQTSSVLRQVRLAGISVT